MADTIPVNGQPRSGDELSGQVTSGHGGDLAMAALVRRGVGEIFTLSGGHVFPIYDACKKAGIRIVDTRHEQTAGFAAEGVAKLTRRPGVAVLTAGPGVTNGTSAITTAMFNGSPLVVLAGRAPQSRWGSGSLQEIDHLPLVAPITKSASTVLETESIPAAVESAAELALTPHRGPVFLDFPLEVMYGSAQGAPTSLIRSPAPRVPDPNQVEIAAKCLAEASRPAVVVGGDVWWEGAWEELRVLVEQLRIPTFVNGMGRGLLPADHELYFSRSRRLLHEADVVAVIGSPLDFRLSFGRFGSAKVVHVTDSPASTSAARAVDDVIVASPSGDIRLVLSLMAQQVRKRPDHEAWIEHLLQEEGSARRAEQLELGSGAHPIHPMRLLGEVRSRLDRDAIVIGDGGDFVSFAGKVIDSYTPGCWMDPGPFGCLGTGLGYAIAARVVHSDRQIVLLAGDGAIGFSAMDVDTLVRHKLPVVIVVGNNGIWGLEKHPMRAVYGYDVAADLQAGCRYDLVSEALGGAGEVVTEPDAIGPALDRGFAAGVPYLVNVVTDPDVVYPRRSNLA